MSDVTSWTVVEGDRFQREVTRWATSLTPAQLRDLRYQAALVALDHALGATIEYMKKRRDGGAQDTPTEQHLRQLWSAASRAVSVFDDRLGEACLLKGLGWTDPEMWQSARGRGLKIAIDDMIEARKMLNARRHQEAANLSTPPWFPKAGVCFALLTVLFLMYLLVGPAFDPAKRPIFNVLMAFCASASAAFLGGDAAAHGRIPFFRSSPVVFSAAGGIGIFVVVFLVLQYSD